MAINFKPFSISSLFFLVLALAPIAQAGTEETTAGRVIRIRLETTIADLTGFSTINFFTAPIPLDTPSEEYQNCVELGGSPTRYQLGDNDALLCRFGQAGVGASSLLNYKNHLAVKSIEAFLDYVAPDGSGPTELAVVPRSQEGNSGVGPFEIRPNLNPETHQPGISLILPPKVQISSYCRQRSGKPTQLKNPIDGSPLKACIFEDFSGIDANTLFKGPSAPENAQLKTVLESLR